MIAPLLRAAAALLVSATACATPAADSRPEGGFAGRRLKACTGCHGEQGRAGPDGYYPRLAGKPARYLHEQLLAFRDGRRRYAPMAQLLEPLSDAYLLEIAEAFAAMRLPYPPPVPAQLDPAPAASAEALVRRGDPARQLPACTGCHGELLGGMEPGTPSLLGLPRDYLNAQLGAWRSGTRRARAPDCMADITRRLQPVEVSALAAWLASQPVPAAMRADPPPSKPLPLDCGSATAAGR